MGWGVGWGGVGRGGGVAASAVAVLLSYGADSAARDRAGRTPLDAARAEAVRRLLAEVRHVPPGVRASERASERWCVRVHARGRVECGHTAALVAFDEPGRRGLGGCRLDPAH